MNSPNHGLIELKLASVSQLFNTMDPSPFHERDLDHDAEEFILSWAREHARDADLRVRVVLRQPADELCRPAGEGIHPALLRLSGPRRPRRAQRPVP